MTSSTLTTTPQYTGQPYVTCPTTQRVVFVPSDTVNNEWKMCEACGSTHRVSFVNGNKHDVRLKNL